MFFTEGLPSTEARAVPEGAFVLDVREPDEWCAGHVPGAVHIPLNELPVRAAEIPQDVDVYVICRSGGRSAHATMALNRAGWRATNIDGGMYAWAAAGRPMVSETGDPPTVA